MKDLLDKLSSYNIFNYLLPGVIFVVLAEGLTAFHFIQKDIVLGVFFYYFIGLIISRLGSNVIEPLLKRAKFIKFSSYEDFVSASKKDEKLNILSEANNMYRTFCSLFSLLILLMAYELLLNRFPFMGEWNTVVLVLGLLGLFCFSYKKQTQYITKRIESTDK